MPPETVKAVRAHLCLRYQDGIGAGRESSGFVQRGVAELGGTDAEALTKSLGEVVRIRKAAGSRYFLDAQRGVGQQTAGQPHTLLAYEFSRRETGLGREHAREMGAAVTRDLGQIADRERVVEVRTDIAVDTRDLKALAIGTARRVTVQHIVEQGHQGCVGDCREPAHCARVPSAVAEVEAIAGELIDGPALQRQHRSRCGLDGIDQPERFLPGHCDPEEGPAFPRLDPVAVGMGYRHQHRLPWLDPVGSPLVPQPAAALHAMLQHGEGQGAALSAVEVIARTAGALDADAGRHDMQPSAPTRHRDRLAEGAPLDQRLQHDFTLRSTAFVLPAATLPCQGQLAEGPPGWASPEAA